MAEKIQALTRQDVINTATPQAFFGGTAGPAVQNSNLDQMVNALNNLIETGGKLALSEREEYKKDERKKGLVRMSTASPEQIENVRKGVDNNIIPASASPFFRQGANEGILKVYGRRFGLSALGDWKKSEEYTSTDPDAFNNWIQKYTETFNKDNHIQGFEEDLVADILIPAQEATANVLQQRHQEKLNKEFEDGYKLLIQNEDYNTTKDLFRSEPFRNLFSSLYKAGWNADSFHKEMSPVILKLTENVDKLYKKKNQKNANKLLTELLNKINTTRGLESTPLYQASKDLNLALLKKYNLLSFTGEFGAEDSKSSRMFDEALYRLKKVLQDDNTGINQFLDYHNYVNSSTLNRRKQGVNTSFVNKSVLNSIAQVARENTNANFSQFMLSSLTASIGTESSNTIAQNSVNNILSDVTQKQSLDAKVLKNKKDKQEELFRFSMVINVPKDSDGNVIYKDLNAYALKLSAELNAKNIDVQDDLNTFIKTLKTTKGQPTEDDIEHIEALWATNRGNPSDAFDLIKREILEKGVIPEKVPLYKFYEETAKQHKTFGNNFYTAQYSDLRRLIAETIDGDEDKVKIFYDSEMGINRYDFSKSDDANKAGQFSKAINYLYNFWENSGDLQRASSRSEWREIIFEEAQKNIIQPLLQKQKTSSATAQSKAVVQTVLRRTNATDPSDMLIQHFKHEANMNNFFLGFERPDVIRTKSPVYKAWEESGTSLPFKDWILHLNRIYTSKESSTKSVIPETSSFSLNTTGTPPELPSIKDNNEIKVTDTIGDDSTDPNAEGPPPTLAEETSALAKKSQSKDIKRINKQLQDELKRPPDSNKLEETKPVLIKKEQKETKPVLTKKESERNKRILLESRKIDAESNRTKEQEVELALEQIRNRRTN